MALALLVGGGPSVAQGFREDEFECEETVARLNSCCDGFDAHAISCNYSSGCGTTVQTTLSPSESRCIRAKSCAEIRGEQICAKVLARQPRTCDTSYSDGGEECTGGNGEVCQ